LAREASTIQKLAAQLPPITERELEEYLFARRFEYMIELADQELKHVLANSPQVITACLQEKIVRVQLGDYAPPEPYEALLGLKKLRAAKEAERALTQQVFASKKKTSVSTLLEFESSSRRATMRNLKEQSDRRRDHLEEEAYASILLLQGYNGAFVIQEVEAFMTDPQHELLVDGRRLEEEVHRLYLEKIRVARRGHDSDEDFED